MADKDSKDAKNAKTYTVVAPYVTLKVRDQLGAWVLRGFYKDAVITFDVEEESLNRHLEDGLLVEGDAPAPVVNPDKVRDGEMVIGSPSGPVVTTLAGQPVHDSPAVDAKSVGKPGPPKK